MTLRKEMKMRKTEMLVATAFAVFLDLTIPPLAPHATAGRGSSPDAIRSAIASNSVDAISAELERAERLVCPSCVTMVRPLVDHQDPRVRRVATWWLARHGAHSDLFIEAAYRLAQPDSIKARNAADVLGSLRSVKAIEPLGAALNNPIFDAEARVAMAGALGRIGEQTALPALRSALRANEYQVRAAALAGIRELRGPLDLSPALPLLSDPVESVRVEAIYTVGAARGRAMEGPQATELVRSLVNLVSRDASADVRKKAAWALGEIGAPSSIAGKTLSTASRSDPEPAVRSLAAAAVVRLAR
jgi:HEAT repeat protein